MGCKKCAEGICGCSTMNAETDRTILERELFDLWATGKYDDWVSPDWSEAKEPFTKWAIANLPQFAPLGSKEMNWESYDKPSFKIAETFEAPLRSANEMKDQSQQIIQHRYTKERVNEVADVILEHISQGIDKASAKGGYYYSPGNSSNQKFVLEKFMDDDDDKQYVMVFNLVVKRLKEAGYAVQLADTGYGGKKYIWSIRWGKPEKNAESAVVQEPDWIPAGDGRAIGQQDFAINLSPLHAETFEAETLHEKGDYRITAEEDYDALMSFYEGMEEDEYKRLEEQADTYGMFYLQVQKKVMGGWETIDSLSGVVPSDTVSLEELALIEMEIPKGVNFDAESFNAERKSKMTTSSGQTFYTTGENVGKYGGGASSGEIAFYQGLPELKRTLSTLSSLDGVNRGIVVDFVNEWKDGSTKNLWDACQDLWAGAKGKRHFTKEVPNWKRAESRFDKLSNEIADEYEEKGMSPEKAQEVGDATAAKIGRAKYGKTGMRKMQKKGMKADMVGSPSPTFNEDITGQDGPSADPTNQTFEAMRTLAPNADDVRRARRDLKNSGYGDVIYDRYMVYRDGSSNKFYYTAVTEKDGKYYPMGAYGRIGYLSKLFNIYGKTENPRASLSTMDAAYRQCSGKEKAKVRKGYEDYTLQMAESFGSETLAEIEGPTAEATTGGLHAPSSFAMTWEDGTGQSSASIPPNEIAWAENVKAGEGKILGIGYGSIALAAIGILGVKKLMGKKTDTAPVDDTKKAEKGCGCSKTVAKSETVTKHSEYSADRINPVEVEGQNDIRNAESISLPQPNAGPQTAHRQNNRPSLKLW